MEDRSDGGACTRSARGREVTRVVAQQAYAFAGKITRAHGVACEMVKYPREQGRRFVKEVTRDGHDGSGDWSI